VVEPETPAEPDPEAERPTDSGAGSARRRVNVKVREPPASAAGAGSVSVGSSERAETVKEAAATGRKRSETARTVTTKGTPAVCKVEAPARPAPEVNVSPGESTRTKGRNSTPVLPPPSRLRPSLA
jgi:hypothetical protein